MLWVVLREQSRLIGMRARLHTHAYIATHLLYSVEVCAPFLPAQWCKDDLKARGSRESPYTQV